MEFFRRCLAVHFAVLLIALPVMAQEKSDTDKSSNEQCGSSERGDNFCIKFE